MFVLDLPPPAPLAGNPYPSTTTTPVITARRRHQPRPSPATLAATASAPIIGRRRRRHLQRPSPATLAATASTTPMITTGRRRRHPHPSSSVTLASPPASPPRRAPSPHPPDYLRWQLPVHGRASSSVDVSSAPRSHLTAQSLGEPCFLHQSLETPVTSTTPATIPRWRLKCPVPRPPSPCRCESGRSSDRFRSPHRASPKRSRQLEHASKGPSPSPKKSQGSSEQRVRHMYDCEDEGVGGRDQYLAERHTAELSPAFKRLSPSPIVMPSPYDHCKSPPDSPVKLNASYEVNNMDSSGQLKILPMSHW